jgi:outer membrane protein OmpA-like peptidoglycan-associated protein
MRTWANPMAFLASAVAALVPATALPSQLDRSGCRDSPLLGRTADCYIVDCKRKAWEEANLPVSAEGKEQAVEGETEQLLYYCPEEVGRSKVIRNAEAALREAGFTVVFSGKDRSGEPALTASQGGYWVAVRAGSGRYWVRTVKTKDAGPAPVAGAAKAKEPVPEATKPKDPAPEAAKPKEPTPEMVAESKALAKALGATGHASLVGISFDGGTAELKPEAEPALKVVAMLLAENRDLKVFVVGHSAMSSDEPLDAELSRQRAVAVVEALASRYGVDRARIEARWVGALAPDATNRTEDGRTRNRRVELVER